MPFTKGARETSRYIWKKKNEGKKIMGKKIMEGRGKGRREERKEGRKQGRNELF